VIEWMDFVLDDEIGPSLKMGAHVCRTTRTGRPVVMDDDRDGNIVGHVDTSTIQETGQVNRPARMVGDHSLDYNARTGTDAGTDVQDVVEFRQKEVG
jgi:hypothetical protein